ncbi:MAG: phage protein Gp36 family protein [Brevinema sp.]
MLYCSKDDLFEACLRSAIEQWAADCDSDTSEQILTRIAAAITRASEEMNLYISKQYPLPIPFVPLSLRDICVKLSLYQLLSRKGFSSDSADSSIKVNYDSAIKQLEQIASGRLDIGIVKSSPQTARYSHYFPRSPLLKP